MEAQMRPTGPMDAKIMIIGECPGEKEVLVGSPFVGPAGRILDGMLLEAGIVREACYITNVMYVRPEGDDFSTYYEGKAPKKELQDAYKRLEEEISQVNPNVIISLGNEALKAVAEVQGIFKWRGSIIESRCMGQRRYKVVPAIHPAAIAREWTLRPTTICDLIRARQESASDKIQRAKRTLIVATQAVESICELERIRKESSYVAFDIETETDQVTAVSFAPSDRPHWSICIPFWFGTQKAFWSSEDELALWTAIKDLLEDDKIGKIAHNGMYDIEFLQRVMGFETKGFVFDTMLGMHTLYPELEKSLAFAVSVYTDHPYYKHQLHTEDYNTFFLYNATDSCLTMEIAEKLMKELKDEKLWDFYQERVHTLVAPLLDMQRRGVRFDYLRRNTLKKRYQEEIAVLQRNLDKAVGHELNVNSSAQMKRWLYEELKLPTKTKHRKTTGETTISADEEALEELFRVHQLEPLKTVLKIREKQKILSTYLEIKLDEDKRIRCSYNITGTETGRLSSSATLRKTGANLQNIPNGIIRSLFTADEGKTFINADLSQAEARIVAYLADERRLIEVFNQGGDIHRRNAANIFRIAESAVSDEQRQLAKRVVHASNYGMGPITFAKTAGIPSNEAKRLLNQYFATYPGIERWHREVKDKLQKTRVLVNPFGRRREFYNRWDESLLREGLAFLPQSTVADIINQGLVCLWNTHKDIELLLQVHDSILCQVSTDKVGEALSLVKECLKVPVIIGRRELIIPVDVKVGLNWADLVKS